MAEKKIVKQDAGTKTVTKQTAAKAKKTVSGSAGSGSCQAIVGIFESSFISICVPLVVSIT